MTQAEGESAKQRQVFSVGRPEEWADFERRNAAFLKHLPSLETTIGTALGGAKTPPSNRFEEADTLIFFLACLCAEDFFEMTLLCANGYGFGATKLLRGLYERVVAARYLRLHPEEADAFLTWDVVSNGKRAREVLKTLGDLLGPDVVKTLEEQIELGKAHRAKFIVPDCKKCNTTRLNHTWSKLDFVSMAKAVDADTGKWIYPCYLEPLRHAHATAGALDKRIKKEGTSLKFIPGPSREEADTALMFGHALVLNVCGLLLEHFKIEGLQDALVRAIDDHQVIWPPDTADTP